MAAHINHHSVMGIFDSDSCKGGDDLLTNLKHISTIHCRISKAKMTYKLSDFWSFCEITCDSLLSHNLKGFYWNQIGLHLTIISIISSSAHYFMINQWINLSIKCQKNSEMGNVQYNFPEPKVTSLTVLFCLTTTQELQRYSVSC